MTFDMPETEAEIPAAMAKLIEQAKAASMRIDAIHGAIKAVQALCSHPGAEQVHSTDIDGGSASRCRVCGRSR